MTANGMRGWLAAAVVVLAGAAWAELPRLPAELKLQRGPDSPGQVVFRHDTHVDAAKPNCVTCHPRRFSILGRSAEPGRAALVHSAMEKGQGCGGCHGKAAFGFDDCTTCHEGS
jgi:c(7)-type cytochrome triheme protein